MAVAAEKTAVEDAAAGAVEDATVDADEDVDVDVDVDVDMGVDADAAKTTSSSPLKQFPPPFTNGNQQDGWPGSSAPQGFSLPSQPLRTQSSLKTYRKLVRFKALGAVKVHYTNISPAPPQDTQV